MFCTIQSLSLDVDQATLKLKFVSIQHLFSSLVIVRCGVDATTYIVLTETTLGLERLEGPIARREWCLHHFGVEFGVSIHLYHMTY